MNKMKKKKRNNTREMWINDLNLMMNYFLKMKLNDSPLIWFAHLFTCKEGTNT